MFETASIVGNSILKDAKEMRKRTEEVLPIVKERAWKRIQSEIEGEADKGAFHCKVIEDYYCALPYEEIVTTLKSKGYRVRFSKSDYKNGFLLYIYWK